jgi:hypothetical protein
MDCVSLEFPWFIIAFAEKRFGRPPVIAIATIEIDEQRGVAIIRCPNERILAALRTGFKKPYQMEAIDLRIPIVRRAETRRESPPLDDGPD